MDIDMRVTKRDGKLVDIAFDKILNRVKKLGQEANIHINYSSLVIKVIDQLYDKIETTKIDELAALQCASLSTMHPDYGVLASRIIISNHQKNTSSSFYETMSKLYNFIDIHGNNYPLISKDLWETIEKNRFNIESMINYDRDYLIDYFGFKTLERAYLFKVNNKIIERPQHMWMRVALGIHGNNMEKVKETYDLMSQKYFTHATPTLFNAGTPRPQLSSCYLIGMEDDSLEGIYGTLKDCAMISKWAGGVGLHIHNVRAKGTHIKGTNGTSNGIVPMLRVFNNTARYVDQCLHEDTLICVKDNENIKLIPIKDVVDNVTEIVCYNIKESSQFSNQHYFMHNDTKGPNDDYYNPDVINPFNESIMYFSTAKKVKHVSSKDIIYIKTSNTDLPLRVTLHHPLLVIPKSAIHNNRVNEMVWLEAECVQVGDSIVFNSDTASTVEWIDWSFEENISLYDLEMNGPYKNYVTENGIVHNGGGKRNGSFAIYLEPWHPDIYDFLELKKNHGDEESKARDLFYALWIPDLFMERVKENGKWSLFCPHECPGLADCYGEQFKELYEKYESEGKARKVVEARELWFRILDAQMETGTPYILYKDSANKKSNQQNIGTVKSSNLCTEIIQYSDDKETAVCNLASIALPTFVNQETKQFDYEKLHSVTKVVTNNLNKIIDINFYPTPKTQLSNMLHRPIGLGVQGLADAFIMMDVAFHSEEAKQINKLIFETIYHAALEESNEISFERYNGYNVKFEKAVNLISKKFNYDNLFKLDIYGLPDLNYSEYKVFETTKKLLGSYSSFKGSPASKGILQFDMWNVKPSDRYDWTKLKSSIMEYGLRNSLLIAPMPTASTSQILGFNECFEPITSNIYSRSTLAGEFVVVNKYLMKELIDMGYWNEQIKNNIIANKGSIQQLDFLPEHIRNKYKIVWEIPMKHIIDMAADRGAYICQSQSLNLWQEDPTYNTLTSMHFYSWNKGLKTGIYYLRRKAKHQAQQFTIEPDKKIVEEHDEICEMCSA